MSDAPLILACDTTQGACSVALYQDGVLGTALQPMRQGHAEALLPMMAELMAAQNLPMQAVGRLAVTHGPGTFTGVRVGLSAMRGLALALNVPLVGYGTLQVMAQAAAHDGPLIVAVDARRATFYAQAFDAARHPLGVPQALSAEDTLALAADFNPADQIALVGSGAALLAPLASEQAAPAGRNFVETDAPHWPQAHILARLAAEDTAWQARADQPAEPLYLRPPDAKLPNRAKFPARAPSKPAGSPNGSSA